MDPATIIERMNDEFGMDCEIEVCGDMAEVRVASCVARATTWKQAFKMALRSHLDKNRLLAATKLPDVMIRLLLGERND